MGIDGFGRKMRKPFGAPQASRAITAQPEPALHERDELRDLAATFRKTVDRLESLVTELEEAHQRSLHAELEKKQFYREVIRAVTRGKFELVDREQIPDPGRPLVEMSVHDGAGYAAARQAIRELTREQGMPEERAADLLLAAGEAITNALKHARDGYCSLYRTEDALIVRVEDRGGGIEAKDLPATILLPGFSTQVSLGMGYTMMLKLCERVWLSTGPEGTVVQLEKKIAEPPPEDLDLLNKYITL